MEQIGDKALEVLNQDSTTVSTRVTQKNALMKLEKCSGSGIVAHDLIGEPVTSEDLVATEEMLRMNYGVEYPAEKMNMLFSMIKEEGWTSARLQATAKWFLKNKKYPNWTVSDWFDYQVKLYPYSWYLEQVHIKGGIVNKEIERYKINGKILFRYADGIDLPFEKV